MIKATIHIALTTPFARGMEIYNYFWPVSEYDTEITDKGLILLTFFMPNTRKEQISNDITEIKKIFPELLSTIFEEVST